jgi:hypothetical protein
LSGRGGFLGLDAMILPACYGRLHERVRVIRRLIAKEIALDAGSKLP